MKRILLILGNDVKRHLKAPLAIMVYLLIPMFMTGIIGFIFGPRDGKNVPLPPISVLLVDQDHGIASRLLLGAFDSGDLKKMFQVTVLEETEGRRRMTDGKASAMVIIPAGFTKRLLEAEPIELMVVKNPAEQFLPDVVEEFMSTMGILLSGAVQVFAAEARGLKAMIESPLESISWAALTPQLDGMQKKLIALKKYLSPLLLRLEEENVVSPGRKSFTRTDLFGILLAGMVVMFLLFIVQNLMRDLLSEREDGKMRRLLTTPLKPLELIVARIAGGWLMGLAVFLIMILMGRVLFGVTWSHFGYLLLLGAAICFWTAAFFALLFALFRNRNQAGAFGSPIILVFSLFGGSMMPLDQLPAAFRWVAPLTPNHWFIQGAGLVRNGRFPSLALLILLASGLILLAVAVPALRRRTTV